MLLKPFRAYRPTAELAHKVAINLNGLNEDDERRKRAAHSPYSIAHVAKPQIDFPDGISPNDPRIFEHTKTFFQKLVENGTLKQDDGKCYYIYRIVMEEHEQTGIIGLCAVNDYLSGKIKKHENTRAEKEIENAEHLYQTKILTTPVFLACRCEVSMKHLIDSYTASKPNAVEFDSEYGVTHSLWVVDEEELISKIETGFTPALPTAYIADGHHRAAAAARCAERIREEVKSYTGDEWFNFFPACMFPAHDLLIHEYNRVVHCPSDFDADAFLKKLSEYFDISKKGEDRYRPKKAKRFGLFLNGEWYKLKAIEGTWDEDAIGELDVTILHHNIFEKILGIKDSRRDRRIEYVPGVKGMKGLEKRARRKKHSMAFSLFPVSMEELMAVSDSGEVMPPKSTWFEPKLIAGLVIAAE